MKLLSRILGRETASERAAWLDSTVRTAASSLQQHVHSSLLTAQRSFQAAETPAWTSSWSTSGAALNEDLARQLPILRNRSRGLGRDNEWASAYLIQLDDNVLGETGIRLQMRLKKPNGDMDTEVNSLIEAQWEKFCQRGNCEVSGKHSWREVESLVLSTLARDGEYLRRDRHGSGPLGYRVQLLNPALLDVALRRDYGGNRVRMGVEINDDGAPVAYWLLMSKAGDAPSDYVTVGRHVRIPASEISHCFDATELDQLRGIPWLTIGARRLWLLGDFEESAAVASSNAAKRQGFFVSPDGEAPKGFADTIVSSVLEAAKASGKVLTADELQSIMAAAEKYSTTVPGQFDTLPQGYGFQPFESVWPNINADTYVKQQVRGWTAARGASYVTVGNDLEAVNYSSAQVGIVGEREHYKALQKKLASWLHQPTFAAALPALVLREPRLRISRLSEYLAAAAWQPRRWQPLDPVKAANANETNLKLKLTTRRRLILERGDDPDEILQEAEQEEKRFGPIVPNTGTPAKEDTEEKEEGAETKRKPGK